MRGETQDDTRLVNSPYMGAHFGWIGGLLDLGSEGDSVNPAEILHDAKEYMWARHYDYVRGWWDEQADMQAACILAAKLAEVERE
jgi:hypothetical protein